MDLTQKSDEELAWEMAQGNTGALEEIIRRWTPRLFSLISGIVGPQAAEEVLQDSFWKAWEQAKIYSPLRGRFSSWLFSIAHRKALDALRAAKVRGSRLTTADAGAMAERLASPGERVSSWQKLKMDEALGSLSPQHRQIVEMVYYEGRTREEIAQLLGLPEGTVKTRLRNALILLRKKFADPDEKFQSLVKNLP